MPLHRCLVTPLRALGAEPLPRLPSVECLRPRLPSLYAGGARSSTLHVALRLVVAHSALLALTARSASLTLTALPVDKASSPLRVAVPSSWRDGPSACSLPCVAVDSPSACPCYRQPRCSRRLLPSIASLRPSTVGPLTWAGCRPRLLLGWSAVCRTLSFQ